MGPVVAKRSAGWQRWIAKSGPGPWVLVALLAGASLGVSGLVAPPPAAQSAPTASYETIVERLDTQGLDLIGDRDLDGIPDAIEVHVYGSDPDDWDTNGDGVPDGWMTLWGLHPHDGANSTLAVQPGNWPASYGPSGHTKFQLTWAETYRFGRPGNWTEASDGPWQNGLDPTSGDFQGDGIPDAWLMHYDIDPRDNGTANQRLAGSDGLTVIEAYHANTDPWNLDTDDDGLTDREELQGYTASGATFPPTNPSRYGSSGLDVCDGYMVRHGMNPLDADAILADLDHDGATTWDEFQWTLQHFPEAACTTRTGLDPTNPSTSGDVIPDGWLMHYGLDPLNASVGDQPTGAAPPLDDIPGVALNVTLEYVHGMPAAWQLASHGVWWNGTDPTQDDTDRDGLSDAEEIRGWLVTAARTTGEAEPLTHHVFSDPKTADGDRDGLPDLAERQAGSDPRKRDTDFDGLHDGHEDALGLDPLRADSIGDELLDGERIGLLADARARVELDHSYPYPGLNGQLPQYRDIIAAQLGASDANPTMDGLLAALAADGDLDGDGVDNAVDTDIDGDGLINGWELHPEKYARSPFGAGPLAGGRPSSDPLNSDTDGDHLVDGWEVRWGQARFDLQRMDPDPSRADTDGDGIPDGDEDPDDDSISWFSFAGGSRQARQYHHSNLAEQSGGTDPHAFSTDGDGLADGWKVFWGSVYDGPRDLDTPPPFLGVAQGDTVIASLTTNRVTQDASDLHGDETRASAPIAIDGLSQRVTMVRGTYDFTFLDAQYASTNPFLADTDQDGMPDKWEYYQAHVRPREADGLGDCVSGASISPVERDASSDIDGDGLTQVEEWQAGSDPLCADTDLGGILDGQEIAIGQMSTYDPRDDQGLRDEALDRDGDGVPDYVELTATQPTDPTNPDTDGDGLLDGGDLGDSNAPLDSLDPRTNAFLEAGIVYAQINGGYVFVGESGQSDPLVHDSRGDGIPDGWLVAHGRSPVSAPASWALCYAIGLPSWWAPETHGPWWGGPDPRLTNCSAAAEQVDRDLDGLHDGNGEDPFPAANQANEFPLGDPRGAESPSEARQRAQASLMPRVFTEYRMAAAPNPDTEPTRVPVRFVATEATGPTLETGQTGSVAGRLETLDGLPAPGVVVTAELDGQTLGATTTSDEGSFALPIGLVKDHEVSLPGSQVFLGQYGPIVQWTIDPALVLPGTRELQVRSYATPDGLAGNYNRALTSVELSVESKLEIAVKIPDPIILGETVEMAVTIGDGVGGIQGATASLWEDDVEVDSGKTDAQGIVTFTLETADRSPGIVSFTIRATHANPFVHAAAASKEVRVQSLAQITLDVPAQGDADALLMVHGKVAAPSTSVDDMHVQLVLGANLSAAVTTTASDGSFEALLPIPPQASGLMQVTATSMARDDVTPASRTHEIFIRGKPTIIDETAVALHPHGPHVITGRLIDAQGAPIPAAPIDIRLGELHSEAMTDTDGRFESHLSGTLDIGLAMQVMQFGGNDRLAPTEAKSQRPVQSNATIVWDPFALAPGMNATINLALRDDLGDPIAGALLQLMWDDVELPAPITDAAGMATFSIHIPMHATLGAHELTCTYGGSSDGRYAAISNTSVWLVQDARTIETPTDEVVLGRGPLLGYMFDATGQPLGDQAVEVQFARQQPAHAISNSDGSFAILPAGAIPEQVGDARIRVTANETSAFNALSVERTIRLRAPTSLSVQSQPLVRGQPAILTVDVEALEPFTAKTGHVTAFLGSERLAAAPVEDGHARIAFTTPDDARAGNHTLLVEYGGSQRMAPSTTTSSIQVRAPTEIHVRSSFVEPGEPGEVLIEVASGDDPIASAPVTVQIEGMPHGFTLTTDSRGIARLPLHAPGSDLLITASYGGSMTNLAKSQGFLVSAAPAAPLETGASPSVYVAGGIMAIAVLAAAFAIWRRRRHPLLVGLRRAQRIIQAGGPYQADIMQAYASLEDHLIDAGFLEHEAETPGLLAEAIRERLDLGEATGALDRLIALFETARYSTATLGPGDRDQVRKALRALQRALTRQGIAWEAMAP